LVERFGIMSLEWAYVGLEAHMLDTMAHTLDDDDKIWRLERRLEGPHQCPY
jgi:hypothetical protein